jgi:hypothetical protein
MNTFIQAGVSGVLSLEAQQKACKWWNSRPVIGGSGGHAVIGTYILLHLHAIPMPHPPSWLYSQAVQLTF